VSSLPVHDAVRFGELRALVRVLLKLDVRAVRILAPALPGLVTTQFFWRHFDAGFFQFFGNRVDVIDFKTKMMDTLGGIFGFGIRLEEFDELARGDLEIKAEEFAVFVEIEMRGEFESVAIKVAGALEVFGEDAEMGQGFDHGRIELKNLALESRNAQLVQNFNG
jgi:hypothetical protein